LLLDASITKIHPIAAVVLPPDQLTFKRRRVAGLQTSGEFALAFGFSYLEFKTQLVCQSLCSSDGGTQDTLFRVGAA
jgi:hypothetical protein